MPRPPAWPALMPRRSSTFSLWRKSSQRMASSSEWRRASTRRGGRAFRHRHREVLGAVHRTGPASALARARAANGGGRGRMMHRFALSRHSIARGVWRAWRDEVGGNRAAACSIPPPLAGEGGGALSARSRVGVTPEVTRLHHPAGLEARRPDAVELDRAAAGEQQQRVAVARGAAGVALALQVEAVALAE